MAVVSIIVPIYNKEKRLKEAIESIRRQTFEDWELILINDGSTDKSNEIAIYYENLDFRVKYHEQKNNGVSFTRNKGISLSQGKYVTFLDADDIWNEKFLEKMLFSIGSDNICYCGHYYVSDIIKKSKMKFSEGDILLNYINNITTPNTNSWLIKKEYLDKFDIRFPTEYSWGEDMIFFSKVLLNDKNVKFANEYLTEYHISNTNCLSENNIDKIEKDIKWMQVVKTYILENELDSNRAKVLINSIDSYRLPAAIVYRIYLNRNELKKEKIYSLMNMFKPYLKKIKLCNGIRSIKLIIFREYLRYL